jgi:hypothetical protein
MVGWAITISAIAWTALHLYAVIDNRVRGAQTLSVLIRPWRDGFGVSERLSGWPVNQLGPWLVGAACMSAGRVIGLSPTWIFYPFAAATLAVAMVMYIEAETLVWNSYRVRKAFGWGYLHWLPRP